jgi:hypothetical protein
LEKGKKQKFIHKFIATLRFTCMFTCFGEKKINFDRIDSIKLILIKIDLKIIK